SRSEDLPAASVPRKPVRLRGAPVALAARTAAAEGRVSPSARRTGVREVRGGGGWSMKWFQDTITVQTGQGQEFIDVTKRVRDVVARSEIRNGMLVVNSLHTTMALFMNEFQSALLHDLGEVLQRLVPRRDGYRHDNPRFSDCDRANGHAHLRATLLG